ncbi:hypothetical protein AC578_2984 [Pseudocercospora eumusae]|uniref:Uncharacterized protein n=1 Tax=Pseudocercospora eumusae TaxID=321146 RepID=A0A139HE63_9PEZI|nr:hypothetical protein AC578_2984 [Pseudocercospora eumusae]
MAAPLSALGELDLDIPNSPQHNTNSRLRMQRRRRLHLRPVVPRYVQLNPVIQSDLGFGSRLVGRTGRRQFSIAVKMNVNGKEQEGKVWMAVDDAEIVRLINQAEQRANIPECDA